ncbi:hypothetical protein FBPa24_0005 [Pseudomonas phage vB_PaeM_FBPa24]|nr:hypothetical protein FBPa24_0005 [Pseudomonas phage vB_PaeM_FBPa24]
MVECTWTRPPSGGLFFGAAYIRFRWWPGLVEVNTVIWTSFERE